MRVKVLQIVWHNKQPIFSLDFDSRGNLATAGADSEIKLWRLKELDDGNIEAEFLSSLTGDKCETGYKTWNCIRFCPTGQSLAAVGDMGQIYNWKPSDAHSKTSCVWRATNCGAYSGEDVMDLCWSADGSGFVTASNDMTCMFWEPEAKGGKAKLRLEGHKLYVQGVAWDPHHQFIVSQGADRSCRVYSMRQAVPSLKKKTVGKPAIQKLDGLYCSHVINKGMPALEQGSEGQSLGRAPGQRSAQHLFHDESLSTFFRRLAWSPDGSILVIPAGVQKSSTVNAHVNVAYVFARGVWNTPLLQLPVTKPEQPSAGTTALPINLPYRMVFAIATRDSILIYDTQSLTPLVVLGGLHLEVITDLAWSADGKFLAASSYDSYCSVASFEEGELGTPVDLQALPENLTSKLWASVSAANNLATASADKEPDKKISIEETTALANPEQPNIAELLVSRKPGDRLARFGKQAPKSGPADNNGLKRARRITPISVLISPQKEVAGIDHQAPGDNCHQACRNNIQESPSELVVEKEVQTMQASDIKQGLSIAQIAAAAGKSAAAKCT